MANNGTPAQTGFSRVFLIEGRARPDHTPSYQSCLRAMGIDKSFGDVTKIECPDPNRYDQFIEVGEIVGADERMTTSLEGHYAYDLASALQELARRKCQADVHVHFGKCTDPSDFNTFSKALVYEAARITSYGTDDLGALASDARAEVNETVDLSVKDFYEVLQLSFQEVAGTIITNEILDGVVCDQVTCAGDDCGDESAGCDKIYFISTAAGGSPGTPADIVFSIDGGANWYAHDIDTLGAAEAPSGVACVGTYVVVVSNDSDSLHYATKSEILPTNDEAWAEVATGFVAAGSPNDIWSVGTYAFVVGDGGYIYGTSDPTGGVTVLDAGVATTLTLNAVHALNTSFAVAVGNSGAIVLTENGETWSLVTPTNVLFTQNWQAVWIKSEKEWFIAGATVAGVGQVWYTLDGGTTWTQLTTMPGAYTNFYDIQFSTPSVVYLTGTISGPRARILRSYDGGRSWNILPEGVGNLPLADRINALATCTQDVNFVVAGGLGDNGTDGILMLGQD
jgi:photosystem II stability/assembly factor-like uncharacterized protein